jgi:hypothetical protein
MDGGDMPECCLPTQTRESRGVSQNYPRDGQEVDLHDIWFQWEPPGFERLHAPLRYRLLVFRYRPGESFSRAVKGDPVYIADNLQTPFHKYSGQSGVLQRDMAYCWRVEARSRENRLVDTSFTQGFRVSPSPHRSVEQGEGSGSSPVSGDSSGGAQPATLYLVPSLFSSTNRAWHYPSRGSDEQLLLKIDCTDGFRLPSSESSGEDSEVKVWYGE